MLDVRRILLASHGTAGALAADEAALGLCGGAGASLFHLTIVPDLWRGMMGDDWLNNAATRDVYCKHVESELGREIEAHRQALEPRAASHGVSYRSRVMLGKPAECLLAYAAEVSPDMVVIGSPRPRGTAGLRSRMDVEKLVAGLCVPLLIVPYPGRGGDGD
ncbi:MAG TPA: universal stress protein [Burkholderiales bacterium]|nr:universal stress protein [Burkholderiales bacterium]